MRQVENTLPAANPTGTITMTHCDKCGTELEYQNTLNGAEYKLAFGKRTQLDFVDYLDMDLCDDCEATVWVQIQIFIQKLLHAKHPQKTT